MDVGVKVTFEMVMFATTLTVLGLVAVVGTQETKEFAKTLEKYKPEVQRINELMTATLKTDTTVKCTKEGGLFKYDISISDLSITFKDDRNPRRQIDVMPVVSYKGKKAIDEAKTSETLISGKEQLFEPVGGSPSGKVMPLRYTILSSEPPAIFRNDETIYYGYFLNGQRLVLNNFDIHLASQRREGDITAGDILLGIDPQISPCVATVEFRCSIGFIPDRKQLKLVECAPGDEKSCKKSAMVCGSAVSAELIKFDNNNKNARCENWKAVMMIDTSEKRPVNPELIEKKTIDPKLKEKLVIGFCDRVTDAYECSFTSENIKFYGPMFVDIETKLENYDVEQCIERI